jgi:hypothetical protein
MLNKINFRLLRDFLILLKVYILNTKLITNSLVFLNIHKYIFTKNSSGFMLNNSLKCLNATGAYERIVKSLKRCAGVVFVPSLFIKIKIFYLLT